MINFIIEINRQLILQTIKSIYRRFKAILQSVRELSMLHWEYGTKKAQIREEKMLRELISGTIVDGNSGQDGMEYVALAAIILVVLVIVGRMIAQKLFIGGIAATNW